MPVILSVRHVACSPRSNRKIAVGFRDPNQATFSSMRTSFDNEFLNENLLKRHLGLVFKTILLSASSMEPLLSGGGG